MSKETILTGIRSNDEPTIGNYLGAILPMVDMAKKHAGDFKINMFVPDLHSFTTPIEHGGLYNQTLRNIKLFIAAGLPVEHEDVYIYRQSYIPAHSELSWILSCFVGFGEAARMVEFKEKSGLLRAIEELNDTINVSASKLDSNVNALEYKIDSGYDAGEMMRQSYIEAAKTLKELINGFDRYFKKNDNISASVGLFNYPILMAADILLYGAKWVPVGEDQRQHLELARDIAIRFNNKFGETFIVPNDIKSQSNFIDRDSAPRVRSLRNPEKKMSKSINDPAGTILLSDNPEEAAKKVMGATTDSIGKINYDWQQQPGVTNLLQMLALLSGKPQEEINAQWIGKEQYGDLKKAVAQEVKTSLTNLQESLGKLDDNEVQNKLTSSEAEMDKVASQTLTAVQQKVGLRPA